MFDYSKFTYECPNYIAPHVIPVSADYKVYLNGVEIPVYYCRISRYPFNCWWPEHQRDVEQSEYASFVNLVSDEEITVEVEPLKKSALGRIMIKPYGKGVSHTVNGNRVKFTLKENGGFVFSLDDYHGSLYIFNKKPIAAPKPDEVSYYFAPGIHFPGKITLKSGDRVYVDKDAFVYGCIFADGEEDIEIFGNGIFDDSGEERFSQHCYETYTNGNLKLYDCNRVKIRGVGFTNSAIWCINLFHCIDVDIEGIAVFGQWRYNTDGVDIVNCRKIRIKDSFIHSFDDTITVKGIDRYSYESNCNMLFENCVLWCDWGRALEIGIETECKEYSDITFRNCFVLRGGTVLCDIQNGDCAHVHDIVFENVSAEFEYGYTKAVLQKNDDMKYDSENTVEIPRIFSVDNARFREQYAFIGFGVESPMKPGAPTYAGVSDVIVRNINIYADDRLIDMGPKSLVNINVHNIIETSVFENIKIENVYLNGIKVNERDMSINISGANLSNPIEIK